MENIELRAFSAGERVTADHAERPDPRTPSPDHPARTIKLLLAGDVLTQPFGRIGRGLRGFAVAVRHGEIDQVHQLLTGAAEADVLVIHTTADFFLDEADAAEARARMTELCAAVRAFAARSPSIILLNTLERRPERIVGLSHLEELALVAELDRKLAELAREVASVSVVDVGGIIATLGSANALSEQNRLAMRMPYRKPAVDAIVAAYEQAIQERYVARKKVVVVDADNTLWGGIVGEDGVDGIDIDMQYPGSVYRRFQQQLVKLSETGVLLALVSKNNPEDVREVFDRRDMPVKLGHFSSVQVNWQAKSDNIIQVAAELNLGLDSMIFIDDNPFELEQVRTALPEVEVYQLDTTNADKALGLVPSIAGLKTWAATSEDRERVVLYRQERHRSQLRAESTSLEDYLQSLDIRLEIGRNRPSQKKRVAQLTSKTNQFNLTTRRYSEADIARLMEVGSVYDVRLQDRFGDMGVIGVVILIDGEIDTFLMSCRALGRNVEGQILAYICARSGRSDLRATFIPTRKNIMVAQFYDNHGFDVVETEGSGAKRYQLRDAPPLSGIISVAEAAE